MTPKPNPRRALRLPRYDYATERLTFVTFRSCAVVMPDHVHALLVAQRGLRLWDVVGAVKARVSRLSGLRGLWQRSFHDHVVRDERDLERARDYIATNPLRWELSRRAIAP